MLSSRRVSLLPPCGVVTRSTTTRTKSCMHYPAVLCRETYEIMRVACSASDEGSSAFTMWDGQTLAPRATKQTATCCCVQGDV
jgi:hypothetical protein